MADPFIRTRLEAGARDFVPREGEKEFADPDHYGLSAARDSEKSPIPWVLAAKLMAMVFVVVVVLVGAIIIFT